MASASSISSKRLCLPCERAETTEEASHWCRECKEGMCSDCFKSHQRMKLLANHDVIPINEVSDSEVLLSELDVNEHCTTHKKEILNMYCLQDEKPCCTVCALSTHKNCPEVVPIEQVAGNYDSEIQKNDVRSLESIRKRLVKIITSEEENEKQLESDTAAMLLTASQFVDKALQKIHDLHSSIRSAIQKKQSDHTLTRETKLKMMKDFQDKLMKHTDTMQLFVHLDPKTRLLLSTDIRDDVSEHVKALQQETQHNTSVTVKLQFNNALLQLENIPSLCDILEEDSGQHQTSDGIAEIHTHARSLQRGLIPGSCAQVATVPNIRDLITAGVKLVRKVTQDDLHKLIGDGKGMKEVWLYDAACAADGRMFTTDRDNKRLLVFDINTNYKEQYEVEVDPSGVCTSVAGDTVHVVCDNNRIVSYTSQGGLRQTSTLKIGDDGIYGIGTSDNRIITGNCQTIDIYKNGQKINTVKRQGKQNDIYICVSSDRKTFYHKDGDTVVGRNVHTTHETFRYGSKSMKDIRGLSTDRAGNILVVCRNPNSIHQITPDGKTGRVLLDKFNSFEIKASAVCCHPLRDVFVVTSWSSDTVMEVYEFC